VLRSAGCGEGDTDADGEPVDPVGDVEGADPSAPAVGPNEGGGIAPELSPADCQARSATAPTMMIRTTARSGPRPPDGRRAGRSGPEVAFARPGRASRSSALLRLPPLTARAPPPASDDPKLGAAPAAPSLMQQGAGRRFARSSRPRSTRIRGHRGAGDAETICGDPINDNAQRILEIKNSNVITSGEAGIQGRCGNSGPRRCCSSSWRCPSARPPRYPDHGNLNTARRGFAERGRG